MATKTKTVQENKKVSKEVQTTPKWLEGFGEKFKEHVRILSKGELGMDLEQLDTLVNTLKTLHPFIEKIKEIQKQIDELTKQKEDIEKQVKEKIETILPSKEMLKMIGTSKTFNILSEFGIIDKEILKVLTSTIQPKVVRTSSGNRVGGGGKRVLIYNGQQITIGQFKELVEQNLSDAEKEALNWEKAKGWISAYDLQNSKKWRERFVERIEEVDGKIYIHIKI